MLRNCCVLLLVFSLVLSDGVFLFQGGIQKAHAAQVQIDATVSTSQDEHKITGAASVFISDQIGYKFYVNSTGVCQYAKTTNGGTSWGTPVTFDSQTDCTSPTIWYDQWTPGDTGTYIHLTTFDTTEDDLWYNRLDTTSDTLLLGSSPVNITAPQGYIGAISAAANNQAITKGTDGTIYAAMSDNNDSIIVECTTDCGVAGNWSLTGTDPLDLQNDFLLMLPQAEGDIMLIRRDISLNDIQYQIWNNSSWPGPTSWSTIDSNAAENTTYDATFAAVVDNDFNIYLAYIDATNFTTANHDVRTAKYSGGSWTNTSDVTTDDTKGLTGVSIGLDENTGDVYVAFTARTTLATAATGNVYWATSTSAMGSWSSQYGPVNTTPEDLYGIDLNHRSDQRMYVSWYGLTSDDMFGDTLADITPQTIVSTLGTQSVTRRASTSAAHIGGTIVIQEFVDSRFVTSITLTETGTIDAATGIGSIALYYDLDTSLPYDCASESYDGGESPYGVTDPNGFSGPDGISIFTDAVTISPSQALCIYPVVEVTKAAADSTTLDIEIANPASDVALSIGNTPVPNTPVPISGSTNIADDDLTQTHFHFRNDDNIETLATSRTSGVQDTSLTALQQETPVRLRFGISNEGSTSTFPTTLRLDYASTTGSCSANLNWIDVDAVNDDWNMYDSSHITDGANSTDISNGIGGVDNENSSFISSNGGLRDTSSTLGTLTFTPTNWTETEFSIIATTLSTEGQTYCFRLSDQGTPISSYSEYPRTTISADVRVSATGTQAATVDIPTNTFYTGGTFVITENSSARNVTAVTLTETGTIDAAAGLANVRLYYELDTSAPYDCLSENYSGTEVQFGATSTLGFSAANGTSTFSGSVAISTTSTMCIYPVMDITAAAEDGQTINIAIESGSQDVEVSGGGSVAPATSVDITGSTTLQGGLLTQTHYHWRQDNGSETTASSSVGTEDTPQTEFPYQTPIRLRLGIDNTGPTTSAPANFRLEYGVKLSTCENVTVWTDIDSAPDAWDMYNSANLTNGSDTTDIGSEAYGSVSNPSGKTFLGTNGGVLDTDSESAPITLTTSQFVELEYSITSTATTSFSTTYCFRLTNAGQALPVYNQYPELTTAAKRDFRVQRGTTVVTGTSVSVTPGPTTYTAPASTSLAFVRITNMHHTGAGRTVGDNTQESDDVTVHISNGSDLSTGFTLTRFSTTNNSVVSWEIVEFIGEPGTDNEMQVRDVGTITLTGSNQVATGSALSTITSDNDVVVYITGIANANTGSAAYYNGQVTSRWSSDTNEPVFERIGAGSNVSISYAVVEYTGINWRIQRVEHAYQAANTTETEYISAVNSLSRTFLHTQKRMGAISQQASFGHEVWLSSIGAVSFKLSLNAATSSGQVSVAWVIENTQTSEGKMRVQQVSGSLTGGTEPRTASIAISEVAAMNNTSVFAMSAFEQNTNNYPRVLGGVRLASTTAYEIYNSDIVTTIPYYHRAEIVEWPTTGLSVRQNYYRFYVNNDELDPTDPWPIGPSGVGENTAITVLDEPIAEGESIRLRLTLQVSNANLPAGLRTYKLQYGARLSTCSAIETWNDVGGIGSGGIWRGYDTSLTNNTELATSSPAAGTLNISVADVAGLFVEENPSTANPYGASDGEDMEYDFVMEHNGALSSTFYCFRVVHEDDTPLDGYNNYPELRTAGFTPIIDQWRWYSDPENETPLSPHAAESVAPVDIRIGSSTSLRLNIAELKGVDGNNVKLKLEYSEYPDFRSAHDVVEIPDCTATSTWCYADGGGANNALINTALLSTSDHCVSTVGDGCGTHNEDGVFTPGDIHPGHAVREYEFVIQHAGARVNAVYYFRAYDLTNNTAIIASSTYPSLVTEGATLVFEVLGVPAATVTEGVTTDVSTTPTSIAFGSLNTGLDYEAAHQLRISTNATEGYRILLRSDSDLQNSYGTAIPAITSTNAAPAGWSSVCLAGSSGCFGYHSGDDVLTGNSTRFSPDDSYAGVSAGNADEVAYSSFPVTDETTNIIYKLRINLLQEAGNYAIGISYIAVPVF